MKLIKMISAILLAALVLVTASCSAGSATSAATAAPNTEIPAATKSRPAPETDKLSFLNDGEIYVELKLDASVKNASVSLDGTVLSGNKAAYKKGMEFTLNGEYAEDGSVNVVIVTFKGEKGAAETSAEFKNGIDVEMVSQVITKCLDRENVQKVFISIFEKGGSWDKSLSEAMNEFILGMYPVLK